MVYTVNTTDGRDIHLKGFTGVQMKETSKAPPEPDRYIPPSATPARYLPVADSGGFVVTRKLPALGDQQQSRLREKVNYFARNTSLHGVRFVVLEHKYTCRR